MTRIGGHLALYRKYRSATFAEVIGQEHVTGPLCAAITAGRINHAYLFSGPRGCGKTSSARILARSLNCAQGPTADPCGVCDSCRELAPNGSGSIDVIEIDAASHGGVDDARDLRDRAFFAPVRDRYKVYIIDEAHMVTTQGFNALLKLVEEPPDFLVFVFATTEPDKVLTTIRSRTHHYPFRLIPPAAMRAHLETICGAESIPVEPSVLPLVVRAGGGSARDSLSILDQLLAGAGPDGVTYARAVALLGVTDGALLDDMVDALAAGDAAAVYGTVDRIVEAGHDPRRFAFDLLDRFRDLIVLDAVPDAAARGLIDAPQDQLTHMSDQAMRLGGAALTRHAEIVHTALLEMRGTTSPRLVLELLCARMQLPDAAVDSAALLQRLERLERRNSLVAEGVAEAALPMAQVLTAAKPDAKPDAPSGPPVGSAPSTPPGMEPTELPTAEAAVRTRPADRPAAESGVARAASPAAKAPSAPASERAAWPEPPAAAKAAASSESGPSSESGAESARATETPTPVIEPAAKPSEAAAPSAPDPAGQLDAAALRRLWPEVLGIVREASKTTWAMLDGAQVTTASGEVVTLGVAPSLAKRIAEDRNTSLISAAFTKVVGGSWQINVVAEGAGGSGAPAGPAAGSVARSTGPAGREVVPETDPRDDIEYDPGGEPAKAVDPEVEAIKLLHDQLGARPIDQS
ncbi:MAG: DNA polymerase III subunit gamma and tau [Jatrophihabitantaceae bacterium]